MNSNQMNSTCEEQVTYEQLKTIRDIQDELWETNVSKGWNKLKRTPLEMHALINNRNSRSDRSGKIRNACNNNNKRKTRGRGCRTNRRNNKNIKLLHGDGMGCSFLD